MPTTPDLKGQIAEFVDNVLLHETWEQSGAEAAARIMKMVEAECKGWRPPLPALGRRVADVCLKWSREDDERPGAGATWDTLDGRLRELYMRCGEALFGLGMTWSPVPVREEPRNDDWCRAEHCPHRNWRSGSAPTHKIGPGCPEPAPASREEPLPDSETEWQWGIKVHDGSIMPLIHGDTEARARGMQASSKRGAVVVRREVGPWIEVTS